MLKEIIALVRDYVYQTSKQKVKVAEKYMWNSNMKSFSNEILKCFSS